MKQLWLGEFLSTVVKKVSKLYSYSLDFQRIRELG